MNGEFEEVSKGFRHAGIRIMAGLNAPTSGRVTVNGSSSFGHGCGIFVLNR